MLRWYNNLFNHFYLIIEGRTCELWDQAYPSGLTICILANTNSKQCVLLKIHLGRNQIKQLSAHNSHSHPFPVGGQDHRLVTFTQTHTQTPPSTTVTHTHTPGPEGKDYTSTLPPPARGNNTCCLAKGRNYRVAECQ